MARKPRWLSAPRGGCVRCYRSPSPRRRSGSRGRPSPGKSPRRSPQAAPSRDHARRSWARPNSQGAARSSAPWWRAAIASTRMWSTNLPSMPTQMTLRARLLTAATEAHRLQKRIEDVGLTTEKIESGYWTPMVRRTSCLRRSKSGKSSWTKRRGSRSSLRRPSRRPMTNDGSAPSWRKPARAHARVRRIRQLLRSSRAMPNGAFRRCAKRSPPSTGRWRASTKCSTSMACSRGPTSRSPTSSSAMRCGRSRCNWVSRSSPARSREPSSPVSAASRWHERRWWRGSSSPMPARRACFIRHSI